MITTLDDFGLNRKTNREIINWTQSMKVDFVSLLANSPFTNDAIQIYKENKNQEFSLGLHFNLIEGKPLCSRKDVMSLVSKKGTFYPLPQFIARLFFGLIKKEEVMRELQKQYDVFKDNQIHCEHISSHQNIHIFHIVYSYVDEFAKKNNIKYIRQLQTVKNRLRKFPIKYLSFIILYLISSRLFPLKMEQKSSFYENTFHPGTTYD